ncbi:MAG TPA: hypothetical protein VF426_10680 [Marmoricola sp.]
MPGITVRLASIVLGSLLFGTLLAAAPAANATSVSNKHGHPGKASARGPFFIVKPSMSYTPGGCDQWGICDGYWYQYDYFSTGRIVVHRSAHYAGTQSVRLSLEVIHWDGGKWEDFAKSETFTAVLRRGREVIFGGRNFLRDTLDRSYYALRASLSWYKTKKPAASRLIGSSVLTGSKKADFRCTYPPEKPSPQCTVYPEWIRA